MRPGGETHHLISLLQKSSGMQLESDYNGGPRPWLQEGDLGGVSCVLGDKRRLVCVQSVGVQFCGRAATDQEDDLTLWERLLLSNNI